MSEVDNEVKDEVVVEVTDNIEQGVPEPGPEQEAAPEPLPKFETAEEKMLAMEEIRLLQKIIDTVYHMPKYDMGNKGRQARKITGSVPLNFFPAEQLQQWGNKVMSLTSRL